MIRPRLRDLLAENIRLDDKQSDDELCESMRLHGWTKELPAIQDERGNILVGNRRLRIADELGIERNVKIVEFGQGDEADAERVKLAITSNVAQQADVACRPEAIPPISMASANGQCSASLRH